MNIQSETQAYAFLLYSHVRSFAYCLRQMPSDRLDWQFDPAAPSARMLAEHMLQWLICDRQHILEPDALLHADVPALPRDLPTLCDALEAEADTWRALIRSLTPEQLDAPRQQFNSSPMNVRAFVCHIIQNSIYKNGQFMTIFYALGLDGTEPYEAPLPNPIYAHLRAGEPLE